MIESLASEVRFAVRGLRRHRGFTTASILTLGLGIGATTAVFAVVYGILLRPLPFPHAERLVRIVQVLEPTPNSPESTRAGLTPNQFVELQDRSATLEAVGGYAHAPRTLTGVGVPMRLSGSGVTPGLFSGLGVSPAFGRMFVPADGVPGADPVVILSHRTWTTHFGGDRTILDRRIALGDIRYRVIAVMPEGFGFPSLAGPSLARDSAGEIEDTPEFWLPMAPFERTPDNAGGGFTLLQAYALLRDDVRPEQSLAEIRSLIPPLPGGRNATLEVVAAHREMADRVARVLAVFQLGVGLVLLIACVNVANLLLTRAAHRRREAAIRIALGASRRRLTQTIVTESVLLALGGGAVGCLFAFGLTASLRALPPHLLPRVRDIEVDAIVLLFALVLSVGTGVAVGLFSAFRAARTDASGPVSWQALRGVSAAGRRLRPSGVLVIVEIAATMVLLTGSGLLVNSFARLMQVNPGFEPRGAMTFRLALPAGRYPTPAAQHEFGRTLLAALRGLPTVEAVAATSYALEGGALGSFTMIVDGRATADAGVRYRFVTPDYFLALGIPIRAGRELADTDGAPGATRAVVNEAFVDRYLSGASAVGRRITYADWGPIDIVGVAADSTLRLDEEASPEMYLPVGGDAPFGNPAVVIRTSTELAPLLPALRDIVWRVDPQLAAFNVMALEEMISHSSASPRLHGLVALWCGLIALVLAGIGLYGVLAYAVGTRTQEFGIRMALGADRTRVVATVMRQGLALSAAGIAIGVAGAFQLSRFLESLLFGLTPRDPATFFIAVTMFVAVAMVACYVPARRATRVNPVVALRAE